MELPIFPPTRTDVWDRCNILDYLENVDRWVPKQANPKIIGGLTGRAFAIGAAILHQGGKIEDAIAQAVASFHTDCEHYATHGVQFDASIEEILDASGIAQMLPKYQLANPFKGWTITDVEQRLPDHGRCVIDVGGYDTDGQLAVADVKYKRNLDSRYEQSTIDEYLTSWQFMHYPWAYGQVKGTPCHRMYLCLVVHKPKYSVRLIPHEIHPETAQIWEISAKAKWKRMADPDLQLEMSTRHKDMFGLCTFYRACFDYHLDPSLMKQDYVIVPRQESKNVKEKSSQ